MEIIQQQQDAIQKAAFQYAELGWPIVIDHGLVDGGCTCSKGKDCPNPGKHPRLADWPSLATANETVLVARFEQFPCSNIGLLLGPASGIVDVEHDSDEGKATAERLLADVYTPSYTSARSTHWLFQFPVDVSVTKAVQTVQGLELRFGTDKKGAQSVLPPSVHGSGKSYAWLPGLSPEDVDIAPLPDSVLRLLGQSQSGDEFTFEGDFNSTPGASAGKRTHTLWRLIGRHLAEHGPSSALLDKAQAWAATCNPPLEPAKVIQHVAGLTQKHLATAAEQQPSIQSPASAELIVKRGDSITPEEVQWLWPGRIPLGKLTLFVGLGGSGKTFVACDAMARISRGGDFPEGGAGSAGEAVIATAEDGLADTLRPRLDAHGADSRRWYAIELVKQGEKVSSLSLQAHVAVLDAWLEQHPDVRLLVLDPLSAYIGNVNSHNDAEVRTVLSPLSKVAEKRRVAVVAIMHLTKSDDAKVAQRISGSIAFINAARCVWRIAFDPDDSEQDRRLFLGGIKDNLKGVVRTGLAFRIAEDRIVWEDEPVFMSADEIDTAPADTKKAEAETWLVERLRTGDMMAAEIYAQGKKAGHSQRTLKRARQDLGNQVRVYHPQIPGPWWWGLTDSTSAENVLVI